MGSTGNPNPWGTYDSYRDCSQGVCSVYCPQWCYVIFPPPPSFYLDDEDDSSSSDFSPLLIALIGILASAFILVSYYTLISKYCNRRRNGSSGAITRDRGISSSATDHWQGNNGATNTNPVIGEGLDESLIKSITVYKYKKGDGFVDSSDCSVCLSEFQENESLKLLPKCNHAFHVPCIDTWLQSHSNCPLCRAFIAGINVTAAIEIVPVSTQPISVHQIDAESAENNATSTNLNHQNGDSVVVSSDLESRLRNETVINGVSTPKPPEVQESRRREEQVERRSASVNSGAVVSIADILREMEDEEDSAGVGTSRRLEEGEGEKTPPSSGSTANQTSGISNFLVRSSVAAMKRSVSTAFTTEKRKNEERLKRFVSNQNCRRFGPRESFFRPHTRLVQRAKLNSHNVVFGDQSQYVDPNPGHSIEDIYEQVFGKPWDSDHPDPNPGPATMSGFAQNAERKMQGMSSAVMNGFKPDALPVYKELVQNFAICDRWFASVPASTHPNRLFVHSATSYGSTNNEKKLLIKGFPQKTIFESLSEAGLTFAIYYQSLPTTLLYRSLRKLKYLTHFHDYGLQFKKDCKEGKLPNYVVVEQRWYDLLLNPANDDHPSHDVSEGQNLVKEVYEALRSSPQWNQILFIITYDEHGGFYDHVPTPVDGVPNPDGILGPPPYNFEFNRLGVRVPTFFISPWIEPGTVLHKPNGPYTSSQYEHSSIPATIKKIFNLKDFLTKRDSWAGTFESAITRDSPRQDCPETLSNPVKLRETVAKENAELSNFQEEQIIMAAGLKGDYKNEELIHKLCKETCVADASKYVTNAFEKFLQDSKEARERGCDENDIVYCVDDECYETTTISIRSIACDF